MGDIELKSRHIWVVVKIMAPFWIPIIIRHLIFRVPKKGTIILTTTHITFSISPPHAPQMPFLVEDTWTPKVSKIMAFLAVIRGFGLLFYILLGV